MREKNFLTTIARQFQRLVRGDSDTERDINLDALIGEFYDSIFEYDGDEATVIWPFFMDLFPEQRYIIYTDQGRLFRADYKIDSKDKMTITSITEVKVMYVPVEQNRMVIFRDKESGQYRFIMTAASSVLNRVGQIDATAFFDQVEQEIDDYEQKPFLTTYHLGDDFSFGEVDEAFRYKQFLVVAGTVDNTNKLGQRAIELLEGNRNYNNEWGVSIGFYADEIVVQEIGGTQVPVITKGRLVEVSILREKDAANYFTDINVTQKNKEMEMGKTRRETVEALTKYLGDDQEEYIEGIVDELDLRGRQIERDGMIYRDASETEEGSEGEVDNEATDVDDENADEEPETNEDTENVETLEVELDEEAVAEIVNQVRDVTIKGMNEEFTRRFEEMQQSYEQKIDELMTVVNALKERQSKADEEVIEQAIDDIPVSRKRKLFVTNTGYRPTQDGDVANENELDTELLANRTLEAIGKANNNGRL